ncbi:MAG: carboxypeptidase-like regulatory domain-containing protein, partial [bacterium]
MPRPLTILPLIGLVLLAALVAVALRPQSPYVYPGEGQPLADELPLPQVRDMSAHLSGRVLDASGAGVAGASLVVVQDGRVHWTYSATEGGFDLPGLSPGVLEVALDHRLYPATLMEGVAGPTPIDLVLPPAHGEGPSVPAPKGVDLAARIQAGNIADLTDFEVALAPSAPPSKPGTGRPRRARTD